MTKPNLAKGIITALVTPSHSDEKVLKESLYRLIELQLKNGIKGFYTLGTYGEGLLLPISKRMKILSMIIDLVPSDFLIINNVSAVSIENSIELAKHTIDLGVRNIASLPPLYYKVSVKELKNLYTALGKLDCNLFVYNNPSKTGFDVAPNIIKQLRRDIPNLVGVKDSTGMVERVIELVSTMSEDFYIAVASDPLILDALIYKADAHVCGVCNAIPELAMELLKSFESKQLNRSIYIQKLINRFRGLAKEYQIEGLVLVKTALKIRGIDVGPPFEPLGMLSESEIRRIKEVINNIYNEAGIKISEGGF